MIIMDVVESQFEAIDKQISEEPSKFIKFWMINFKCCLALLITIALVAITLGTFLLNKLFDSALTGPDLYVFLKGSLGNLTNLLNQREL